MKQLLLKNIAIIILLTFITIACKNENSTSNIKQELYTKTDKTKQLSAFIEKAMNTVPVIPGVSVIVVGEKGPLFIKTFGYADYENKIKATEQTDFYIASCTKSFTGLLATILEEEGKIDLSQKITSYKPFKNFKDKTAFEDVSVMDLLSHQSGLENPYLTFRLAYSGQYTNEEILDLIEYETHKNEAGKIFSYTNLGYYLLGVIIQAELGESWKDLLDEKIFKPLKMKNSTAYVSDIDENILALPHLGAYPDRIFRAQLVKTNKTMHPAGGLVTNAIDIANFISFYINEGSSENQQIYSKKLVKSTYSKQTSTDNTIGEAFDCYGYATGWLLGNLNDNDLVLHYGAYEGYRSHISFIPEKKLGIAVFINHELANQFINEIVKYAYNLYLENDSKVIESEQKTEEYLSDLLVRYQEYINEREKKFNVESWNLSHEKEMYTGTFVSNKMGTINIVRKDDSFSVTCGNMKSIATPHLEKDCMWVKLESQAGETICFENLNSETVTINYEGTIFSKIKE